MSKNLIKSKYFKFGIMKWELIKELLKLRLFN